MPLLEFSAAGIHELESIPAISGKIHRYKRKIKFETPQDKDKNSWMDKWSDLTSSFGGFYKKLLWSYFLCPSLFSLEESVKADKVFDNFDKK